MDESRPAQPSDRGPGRPVRVLVAEDSPTARALLVATLESDPRIRVVDIAIDGQEAVDKVRRLEPDLVTMDIRMPRMDGFEATLRIMGERPTPILIVSGSVDHRDVKTSLDALRRGALGVLPKLPAPSSPAYRWRRTRLLEMVVSMAAVRVRAPVGLSQPAPRLTPGLLPAGRPDLDLSAVRGVAIAASTGGPAALRSLLQAMGPDLSVPLFLVQHIAPDFGEGFVSWLDAMGFCPVRMAVDGAEPQPGVLHVAPDDQHLGFGPDRRIRLSDAPPVGGFRPAGTWLFESLAGAFGRQGLGVVLTGMGSDGLAGIRHLKERGGQVLAQDEESSVVWGMPGAVVKAGLSDAQLPPAVIGEVLKERLGR